VTYLFRTPTRAPTGGARVPSEPNLRRTEFDDGPEGSGHLLMRHVSKPLPPVAVLIEDGVVREKQVPTFTEQNAADYCYLGGHDYTITQAERDLLVAAGYDVLTI
jgi:hypothetical protein